MKILVVEDDQIAQGVLESVLKKHGHDVLLAGGQRHTVRSRPGAGLFKCGSSLR